MSAKPDPTRRGKPYRTKTDPKLPYAQRHIYADTRTITYTGTHRFNANITDGNAGSTTTALGITFTKNTPVEVSDKHALAKLSANPFFTIA
jgi:hypothetical protein